MNLIKGLKRAKIIKNVSWFEMRWRANVTICFFSISSYTRFLIRLKKVHSLTIVTIETSPNKLVVMCDLVHNSTKTAYTVLYNLRSKHKWCYHTVRKVVSHLCCAWFLRTIFETDSHAVFDDELHQVFFYCGEESLTWVLHQRHDQLQDLGHITYHHEVILSLKL